MKRWIAALVLLGILAGSMSACTPSGGEGSTEPPTQRASASPQIDTATKDGVTLRVTVQNPVCGPGDTVEVEAAVTNDSAVEIEYWMPMSTPGLHLDIKTEIGNDALIFPDIDLYEKGGDTGIGRGSIPPGETYTQKMRFYAGSAGEGANGGWAEAAKTPASVGEYMGSAVFRWGNEEALTEGKSVSVKFHVTVRVA